MDIDSMVRINECFECGAKETETKLVHASNGPILCEKRYKSHSNKQSHIDK